MVFVDMNSNTGCLLALFPDLLCNPVKLAQVRATQNKIALRMSLYCPMTPYGVMTFVNSP